MNLYTIISINLVIVISNEFYTRFEIINFNINFNISVFILIYLKIHEKYKNSLKKLTEIWKIVLNTYGLINVSY